MSEYGGLCLDAAVLSVVIVDCIATAAALRLFLVSPKQMNIILITALIVLNC